MCGIAGIVDPDARYDRKTVLAAMSARLAHRGPDDHGIWEHAGLGIGLAHRRLAIVDLSSEGHQPMSSRSGRLVIVLNGEIYNHKSLRRELDRGYAFRGHSDTEVLLAAIETWGLSETLGRTIGMFAFALFDAASGRLHLVRDRLGKKPLYYGRIGGAFAFASELKAFAEIPDFAARIDRNSVAAYFRHNYVPAPHSILAGIRKLTCGTVLTLDLTAGDLAGVEERYWYAPDAYRVSRQTGSRSGNLEAAADSLEAILTDAVGLRMLADVPVGAFLSAGIDSTTVVALMQRQASTPVRTFTIGFQEKDFDEAQYAREIALHLGTSHTEMYVSPAEAREVIPLLPQVFDEPFADSSQIPTYLVSRLARQQVTVVLSGDGGDEAFLGYERYPAVHDAWKRIGWLPRSIRGRLQAMLARRGPSDLERWLWWVAPLVPQFGHTRRLGESLQKAAELLAVPNRECFYRAFVSHEKDPQRLVIGSVEPAGPMLDERCWVPGLSLVEHAGLIDVMTYLPDDILVKVDRSTMALGLEARAPLLDHRVVEFGWSLPTKWKLHGHRSKRVLRAVVERYVPPALMNRPKTGFGVPVRDWLRGPLRGWMTDLLAGDRIRREGILRPDIVERYVDEHLKGTQDWHARLWDLLMFEAWLAEYSDRWRMSS